MVPDPTELLALATALAAEAAQLLRDCLLYTSDAADE